MRRRFCPFSQWKHECIAAVRLRDFFFYYLFLHGSLPRYPELYSKVFFHGPGELILITGGGPVRG